MILITNKRPVDTWTSLAAPGVSLSGKARGSEGRRKEEKGETYF